MAFPMHWRLISCPYYMWRTNVGEEIFSFNYIDVNVNNYLEQAEEGLSSLADENVSTRKTFLPGSIVTYENGQISRRRARLI